MIHHETVGKCTRQTGRDVGSRGKRTHLYKVKTRNKMHYDIFNCTNNAFIHLIPPVSSILGLSLCLNSYFESFVSVLTAVLT